MTGYIDAILYFADTPGFVGQMARKSPEKVKGGVVEGFSRTPMQLTGAEGLCYIRMTLDEAKQWRTEAGVTILAEAPYTGPDTPDKVYAALEANPAMRALYARAYPRQKVTWKDADGDHEYTPPPRFGIMG
jgi:hypothetical protein